MPRSERDADTSADSADPLEVAAPDQSTHRRRFALPGTPAAALTWRQTAKFTALTIAAATSSYYLLSPSYPQTIRLAVAGIVAASMILTAQLVRTLRPRVGRATAWAGVFVVWTLSTPVLAFAAGSCATLTGTCGVVGFAAWANVGASWAVTLMSVWGFLNVIPSLGKLAHTVTRRITQLSKGRTEPDPSPAGARSPKPAPATRPSRPARQRQRK